MDNRTTGHIVISLVLAIAAFLIGRKTGAAPNQTSCAGCECQVEIESIKREVLVLKSKAERPDPVPAVDPPKPESVKEAPKAEPAVKKAPAAACASGTCRVQAAPQHSSRRSTGPVRRLLGIR